MKRATADGYVAILEDLLPARRMTVFARRAKRALIGHTKFYFFDCGVYRRARPRGPMDVHEQPEGQALEGLVLHHLQAWIDYSGVDAKIHFRRTAAGTEVDFILYGEDTFLAVEATCGKTVHELELRPLLTFVADYPEAAPICPCGGTMALNIKGINCLPVEAFLRRLVPGKPIPTSV